MFNKRVALVIVKVSITSFILLYLFAAIDLKSVIFQVKLINPFWASAALAVFSTQIVLASVRWYITVLLLDGKFTIPQSLRIVLAGHFFSQFLPSSLGGDAIRVLMASKSGISWGRAVLSIFLDRFAGLVGLIFFVSLAVAFFPLAWEVRGFGLDNLSHLLAVCILIALVVFLLFGEKIYVFLTNHRLTEPLAIIVESLRMVFLKDVRSLHVVTLSLAIQFLIVLVVYFLAKGLAIDLSLEHGLVLIPTVMLFTMIPISFAGWGVREGAMVVALGVVGIPAADALAISVSFGLTQLIMGLPGAFLLLRRLVR